mgnify:CR=1
MNPNLIPTEAEIEMQAALIFPDNKELQSSFILGAYRTIYYDIKPQEDETQTIPV